MSLDSPRAHVIPNPCQIDDLDRAAERRVKLEIRTHIPATVVTFDPATQTAVVLVDQIPVLIDPITGKDAPQLPLRVLVPVVFPGDSESYLSWPILPGTTGTLHVHDRSIARWLARSKVAPVDPVESATHQIHDAEFVPGLTDNTHRIPVPIDLTAIVLQHATAIKLGRSATLGVARLGDDVAPTASMTTFMAAVVTALNTIAAAVPVVIVPPIPPTLIGDIATASTKVKAE